MSPTQWRVHHRQVTTWKELVEVEAAFDPQERWAFRGQPTDAFPAPSLERHARRLGISGSEVQDLEVKLILDFARRFHQYRSELQPSPGDTLEWLSWMRHYGTPTRLLDFTYSFFVAAYFALEDAEDDAFVWAVNTVWLEQSAAEIVRHLAAPAIGGETLDGRQLLDRFKRTRDGRTFRILFMKRPQRFAYVVNPLRLNERQTLQQGLFIAPGDAGTSFEENVRAMPAHSENVSVVVLRRTGINEVLEKLHRIGINRSTLFPGLDGFAQSMRTKSFILLRLPTPDVDQLDEL